MNEIHASMLSIGRFDAFTVTLFEPDNSDTLEQVRSLLQTVISRFKAAPSIIDWSVSLVDQSRKVFDVIAPDENDITTKLAFDIRNELLKQPAISDAEALFDVVVMIEPEEEEDSGELIEPDSDIGSFSIWPGKSWWDKLTVAEHDTNWNHAMVGTKKAWETHKGKGIRIAHPDTGFIPHFELAQGDIDLAAAYDFYDDDGDPTNVEGRGGNHGLGTSSVIIGDPEDNQQPHSMHGVAPEATIIPYRIAKNWAPIFVTGARPRRVRNAVNRARECNAQVISMSLGGVFSRSLHDALQAAVAENIIICSAAGNGVGIVVWPALYEEVIAVAACGADGEPWEYSSHGRKVEVTAPGHNVWRAQIDEGGLEVVRPGSGTSYATPHVASAAALWLASHGLDFLTEKYAGIPLYLVFRAVLRHSCRPWPDGRKNYGAGILDIPKLLVAPLPEPSDFDVELGSFGGSADDILRMLYEMFDEVTPEMIQLRLARLLNVSIDELAQRLAVIHHDELLFRIVTSAELRRYFAEPESDIGSFGIDEGVRVEVTGHAYLLNLDLSDDLKAQIV